MDHAFWKGVLLIAIALVAALIYRFLVARLFLCRINPKSTRHDPPTDLDSDVGSAPGDGPTGQHYPIPVCEIGPADSDRGYLASLLINEVPFPVNGAYASEADTRAAMLQILWVLDSRIHQIPPGYLQQHVAGVQSQNIIDVITGAGGGGSAKVFIAMRPDSL